ncbi:MAG: hypothetical protein AB8B60_19025 [Sulfitobacter sp.]
MSVEILLVGLASLLVTTAIIAVLTAGKRREISDEPKRHSDGGHRSRN